MTMFKKAFHKSWTLGVWSGCFASWTQDDWTLGLCTPKRLDSGLLDAWTLDPWSQEILSIFKNIYFFLLIN